MPEKKHDSVDHSTTSRLKSGRVHISCSSELTLIVDGRLSLLNEMRQYPSMPPQSSALTVQGRYVSHDNDQLLLNLISQKMMLCTLFWVINDLSEEVNKCYIKLFQVRSEILKKS